MRAGRTTRGQLPSVDLMTFLGVVEISRDGASSGRRQPLPVGCLPLGCPGASEEVFETDSPSSQASQVVVTGRKV